MDKPHTRHCHSKNRFDPVNLRRTVLNMAFAGSTVHIACAFSIIEIVSALYSNFLRYPNNNPNAEGRDFLVLSKGHGVMALYACMLEMGWLTGEDISNYFSDGSKLSGLSDSRISGLEVTSGSLGHGFSVGVGVAMGLKRKCTSQKVYAIVGDGELNEGAVWEGIMLASHQKLDNLMLIVDRNEFQAMGKTDEIISLGDLSAKFSCFGFETLEVDGHDLSEINSNIQKLWLKGYDKPKALIANTVKGKGVSFMEADNRWHYTRLSQKTYSNAMRELDLYHDHS